MEETPKEEEIPQEEIHSESEYGDFESPIFYTTTYSSQEEDEETTQNLLRGSLDMTAIVWDDEGNKKYEAGVDRGVFYPISETGKYTPGVAWNGLTSVNESPSGAEATKSYADNIPYLTMISAEEYGATIEAYTYPDEFAICDGSAEPVEGVQVGQQPRKPFGFSYRTKIGNDTKGLEYGYKLHLVYNALAAPSEKEHGTINDSPEASTLSWELTTTPIAAGQGLSPTASVTIDSTKVSAEKLALLEAKLYGDSAPAELPLPAEVITMLSA